MSEWSAVDIWRLVAAVYFCFAAMITGLLLVEAKGWAQTGRALVMGVCWPLLIREDIRWD